MVSMTRSTATDDGVLKHIESHSRPQLTVPSKHPELARQFCKHCSTSSCLSLGTVWVLEATLAVRLTPVLKRSLSLNLGREISFTAPLCAERIECHVSLLFEHQLLHF